MDDSENYEILKMQDEETQISQNDYIEKANIDIQVSTAKKYPRDPRRSVDNSIVMVTMNKETAESCGYALSRGNKIITGPSVHLAKIVAHYWGNMRSEAKVVQITDKQVVSRGVCWDLESNNAAAFEVRRSIIDSKGKRYSDDMITVTGNASNSIAYRNAVFSIIPRPIIDRVYQAAQNFLLGDLSDADKLLKQRTSLVNKFKNNYNIIEEEVIKLCGKQTINQINAEEIAFLFGIIQSLKDGDTTVDDLMAPIRKVKEDIAEKKQTMKSKKKRTDLP